MNSSRYLPILLGILLAAGSWLATADETEALFVDVRTWIEHQSNGIEGHLQLHYQDIADQIGHYAVAKDQPIYVYCAAGVRAERARQSLLELGYTKVTNLGGVDQARSYVHSE